MPNYTAPITIKKAPFADEPVDATLTLKGATSSDYCTFVVTCKGRNGFPRRAASAVLAPADQAKLLKLISTGKSGEVKRDFIIEVSDDTVSLLFTIPGGSAIAYVKRDVLNSLLANLSVRLLDDGTPIGVPIEFGCDDDSVEMTIHGDCVDVTSELCTDTFDEYDVNCVTISNAPRDVLVNLKEAIEFALEHME